MPESSLRDAVEVVIPTRNAPAALWLTLTHLFAYAARGVARVTLLDNRSDAPGAAEVLDFARRAGALVVRHEANVGVWASVNRGLALARSRWVLVLTADVLLGPGAVGLLRSLAEQAEVPFLGPEVATGLGAAPVLAAAPPEAYDVDLSTYNGAAFLLDWGLLREKIGWFDPQFYVCCGDTDYVERLRADGLGAGVARGLPCVHLDKQSRRADGTARADSEAEVRDLARLRAKWSHAPAVIARHGLPTADGLVAAKGGESGWRAELVG